MQESPRRTPHSPRREPRGPQNTRAGSPVELQYPPLADNVDEDLEAAVKKLNTVPRYRRDPDRDGYTEGDPNPGVGELVEEGLVVGGGDSSGVGADNVLPNLGGGGQVAPVNQVVPHRPIMVNFEDENGVDDDRALQEATRVLRSYEWDACDLNFYFGQVEIKMASVGVKKQFTKFQALSTILPRNVIEEIKPLLSLQESEFENNNNIVRQARLALFES